MLIPKRILLAIQNTNPVPIHTPAAAVLNFRPRHTRLPIQRPRQVLTRPSIQLLLLSAVSRPTHALLLDAHLHLLADPLAEVLVAAAVGRQVGDGVLRERGALFAEDAAVAPVAHVVEPDRARLRVGRALRRAVAVAARPAFGELRCKGSEDGGERAAQEGEDHGEVGGDDGDKGFATGPVASLLGTGDWILDHAY